MIGKIANPYIHYTVLAPGVAGQIEGFECRAGNAIMGMKVWASSPEVAADMIQVIGRQIGFEVTDNVEIYNTDPIEPPRENPYGYDIQFTPFD